MTDFRVLCADLLAWAEKASTHYYQQPDVLVRARAALAQPEPEVEGPTDEELLELTEDWPATTGPRHDLSGCPEVPLYSVFADEVVEFARAVLARFGHQPAPPAEDDCPACECVPKPGNQPCAACGRPALAAEAVVEGPSLEEVECLCEEHCFNVEGYESIECLQGLINEAITRWGRPAPAPAGEVAELVAWLRSMANADLGGIDELNADRAADLLERQATACAICERERLHQSTRAADLEVERHPAPVPVSERLPGPEDCDGEGRCWWLLLEHECDAMWRESPTATHWLPATALPLPQGGQ